MTARTTEVSAEAGETGRQASEVRENATGLNDAMEELRHSVIRAVRTSTTEVDRRSSLRDAVDLGCRITIGGQTCTARIVDLSAFGARVDGAPASAIGTGGTLAIDGVGYTVPFTVRRSEDDTLGLAFALDAAATAKLNEALGRLGQLRAA
jgi:methyl-accepting chemotaxis protein